MVAEERGGRWHPRAWRLAEGYGGPSGFWLGSLDEWWCHPQSYRAGGTGLVEEGEGDWFGTC